MTRPAGILFALALSLVAFAPAAGGQTGSIEFIARATPSSGKAEPVRGLTFYLLSKSFHDIQKEADASEPKLELEAFIDKLGVSKELKAWMKRMHSVSLSGEDFVRSLSVNDILSVPEFREAYITDNISTRTIGLPAPKYRESDRERNSEKYKKQVEEYNDALRRFLTSNPQSVEGIDLVLVGINPSQKWEDLSAQRLPIIRRRALRMAETRFLAAKTETDLDGRGVLRGIPPGNYWLGTLNIEAEIGDARLRWDMPVAVRANEVTRAELSNFNAVEPVRPAP